MFDIQLFVAFIAAAAILTITPGTDTALVLRSAAIEGRRSAILAGLGICIGCLIWGGAVSLGLGGLLRASELAYNLVKFAGAAYLLWLGIHLILKPRVELHIGTEATIADKNNSAFWRGFLTNILNPKIGIFYISFLPQFVPAGANVAAYSFFLAGVHAVLGLIWFALLIAATVPLGRFMRQPKVVRTLDRLTGGIFIAFGVRLALSSNR